MNQSRNLHYVPCTMDWELANRLVAARSRSGYRKESAELEGAMGEIAFAAIMRLPMPEPLNIYSDGGIDFRLPHGPTVDVKAISGAESWRLGLLVPKRMRAGIYALIHVGFAAEEPSTFLGWATGGFVAANGQDRGDHYRVHQRDLRSAGELLEMSRADHKSTS
jgi:hypothetical protein